MAWRGMAPEAKVMVMAHTQMCVTDQSNQIVTTHNNNDKPCLWSI